MWLQGFITSMTLLTMIGCNLDRKGASAEEFPPPAPLKDTVGIKLLQGFGTSDMEIPKPLPEPAVADTMDSTSLGNMVQTAPRTDSSSVTAAVTASTLAPTRIRKPGKGNSATLPKTLLERPDPISEAASQALWSIPKTLEGAKALAQQHCPGARYYLNRAPDTAMKHVLFALSIYENGSLFYLKARLHLNAGKYPEAVSAAERSISLNDHWLRKDLVGAYEVKYLALRALANSYPSEDAELKANKAQASFMMRQNDSDN